MPDSCVLGLQVSCGLPCLPGIYMSAVDLSSSPHTYIVSLGHDPRPTTGQFYISCLLKTRFIFTAYMYVCLYVCMYLPHESEKSIGIPGAGAVGVMSHHVGPGNPTTAL